MKSANKNTSTERSRSIPQLRFPEFKGEWEKKKLGEIAEINPSNKTLPDDFIYIDLESVVSGELLKENLINKNDAPSRAQRVLDNEDVLFQMVRPYQKNNFYFNRIGNYVASTGYAQIRTKQNSMFVFQYLHFQKFVDKVIERCTGTSYPAINSTDLSNILISLPSLPEQTHIAQFFTSIDQKISQLKQKKNLLEQYKKGVMQKIFKPSALGYIGLKDERIIEENEILQSSNPKNHNLDSLRFKDEDGEEFPEWEEKKLGEVGKFFAGGDLDKLDYSKVKDENHIYPIYANGTGEGIYGYATTFQYNSNCVTVSGRGNLGNANARIQKFNAIVRLIVIEPKEFMNPKFLEEIINNTKFAIESTGVPQLTVPQIISYKILIPCLAEQTKIANFLTAIDEKISHCSKQIQKTEQWKKGLLQKMFV